MRLKRKILLAVAIIVLVLVLWPVMSHRVAKRSLDEYSAQLAARGEKLSPSEIAPHFTADQQSAARDLVAAFSLVPSIPYSNMPPYLKILSPGRALVNWLQEILPNSECSNIWPPLHDLVEMHTNVSESLRALLEPPPGGVYLDYNQGMMLPLPHLAQNKRAAVWLSVAAKLHLHEGRTTQAFEELQTCMALSHFCEREPIIISQLVRVAILNIAVSTTWEALQCPGLTERELADLQKSWEAANVFSSAAAALEMERAMMKLDFERFRNGQINLNTVFGSGTVPSSANFIQGVLDNPGKQVEETATQLRFWLWKVRWSYDEQLFMMQNLQAGIEASRKMKSHAPLVAALKEYDTTADQVRAPYTNMMGRFFLGLDGDYVHGYLRKLCMMEAQRELTITAIALKRFQLVHHALPDELKELLPDYLASIPLDPLDGKPLRYHPHADGTFLLYSVGEDGVDDGGDPGIPKTPNPQLAKPSSTINWVYGRDLVWPMPATAQETETYLKSEMDAWRKKSLTAKAQRDKVAK